MLDRACDDPSLDPLRSKVISLLSTMKQQGAFDRVSVYFRFLDSGRNFSLNDEQYSPGSLMKVLTLITYLKDAEKDPALLNRKITYDHRFANMPVQQITSGAGVQFGNSYTIESLLYKMIVESDNEATSLLNERIDVKVYYEVLSALTMSLPDIHQTDYPITAEEMSRFFRLLYNSSFLSPNMSDKALELLTKTNFKNGLCRDIGNKFVVAHKFGEKNLPPSFQLHEAGIFFTGNADYVLVVMTEGKDQQRLNDVLAQISKLIIDELIGNYGIIPSGMPELTERKQSRNITG
jgi:beta-lactamase class A